MKTLKTKIAGALLITPEVFHDYRGEYVETYSEQNYQFKNQSDEIIRFVEDDISVSRKDVLRGLHGDSKTWKLIQCLYGSFYYVVVDLRKNSPTYMQWDSWTLNDRNRQQILVPAGCANGHLCLSEMCIFSYKQSQYYSGMEKQFTLRWDHPAFNLHWPHTHPILSQRDANAVFLDV